MDWMSCIVTEIFISCGAHVAKQNIRPTEECPHHSYKQCLMLILLQSVPTHPYKQFLMFILFKSVPNKHTNSA